MKRYRKTFTYDGKRYEVTGKSDAEVIDKMVAMKMELEKNGTRLDKTTTVEKWFYQWLETYKAPSVSPQRVEYLNGLYKNHIGPFIGSMRLYAVKPLHCQRCLNAMAGYATNNIRTVYGIANNIFKTALNSRMIAFNPAEGILLPKGTDGSRRAITASEREILLNGFTGNLAVVIRLMLWAGLRINEAAALQWCNIDFRKNEIHVCKAVKSGTKIIGDPKSKSGIRYVPMQLQLRDYLLSIRGEPFDYLIQPQAGCTPPVKTNSISGYFIRCRSDHGLPDDISLYSLRHTFCTDLEAAGVPINIASKLMGHSNISITAKVYTHTYDHILHSNIALLDVEKDVEKENKKSKTR